MNDELINICRDVKNHYGLTIDKSYKGYRRLFEEFRQDNTKHSYNLSGMLSNGLSEDEAFFILCYTASYSSWINGDYRAGEQITCPCKAIVSDLLDKSLAKVQSYNGELIFRMDYSGNDYEVMPWFKRKIGLKFNVPYFLSTAKHNYNNGSMVWQIKTLRDMSYAKDISNITQNPSEEEVLFRRNSKFIVDNVDVELNIVYLTELNHDSAYDVNLAGLFYLR